MTSVLNRSVYDSLTNRIKENGFIEQFLNYFLLSLSLYYYEHGESVAVANSFALLKSQLYILQSI